jgi:hypothetical protein
MNVRNFIKLILVGLIFWSHFDFDFHIFPLQYPSTSSTSVLFTFLSSSGDFGGAPHANISNGPFIGSVENHMSSHFCKSAGLLSLGRFEDTDSPRMNGACLLRNIYYSASATIPDSEYPGVWTFATSVPAEEVERGLWGKDRLRDLIWSLENELRVSLSSRIPHKGNMWPFSVAVYSASKVTLPSHERNIKSLESTKFSISTEKVCEEIIQLANKSPKCNSSSHLDEKSRFSGKSLCVPPGVHANIHQPLFLLPLTNDANLGHSLWDDVIPFFAISNELGLSDRLHKFDLLLLRNPSPWQKSELLLNTIRELFHLTSPRQCPQDLLDINTALNGKVALFSEVAGGLTQSSPHNLRPDFKGFGWQSRSVWRMRQHVLEAAGMIDKIVFHHDNNISNNSLVKPKYNLLYVRSKRSIRNEAEVLSYLRREFKDVNIVDTSWESLGGGAEGLKAEILQLTQTHILLSGDGSVSTTVPFLPAGAVHIQLGSNRPWGTQFKIDMLLSNLDHVRVLYYSGREPGEHDGNPVHDFEVPPQKLAPLVDEALRLLNEGFEIPVPPTINVVPSARLLSHLITKFPDFAAFIHAGSITWEDIKNEPYEIQAPYYYRKFIAIDDSHAADVFEQSARQFCETYGCKP